MIARGNESVIRARFADAAFFVGEDLKRTLRLFRDLDTLTFQKELGSMKDKTDRITGWWRYQQSPGLYSKKKPKTAGRAAHLCKADLATRMVVEMTALQGIIGQRYALESGEPEAVAEAIFEHYLPRSAGEAVPSAKAGLVVEIATDWTACPECSRPGWTHRHQGPVCPTPGSPRAGAEPDRLGRGPRPAVWPQGGRLAAKRRQRAKADGLDLILGRLPAQPAAGRRLEL